MKSFQISLLQPFEMINELFADTVVICHHEKLFTLTNRSRPDKPSLAHVRFAGKFGLKHNPLPEFAIKNINSVR